MKTMHYDAYIMRIIHHFEINLPNSDYSTIGSLKNKTLSLMGLPKQYQSRTIMTFEHWLENQVAGQSQPFSRQQAPQTEATPSSQPYRHENSMKLKRLDRKLNHEKL